MASKTATKRLVGVVKVENYLAVMAGELRDIARQENDLGFIDEAIKYEEAMKELRKGDVQPSVELLEGMLPNWRRSATDSNKDPADRDAAAAEVKSIEELLSLLRKAAE